MGRKTPWSIGAPPRACRPGRCTYSVTATRARRRRARLLKRPEAAKAPDPERILLRPPPWRTAMSRDASADAPREREPCPLRPPRPRRTAHEPLRRPDGPPGL